MTEIIYYCPHTGNRLRKLEDRKSKMALFRDLEDGTHILCHEDSVDMIPRHQPKDKQRFVDRIWERGSNVVPIKQAVAA